MVNVFDTLKERGFIKQAVFEDELRELLGKEKVTFYVGFDPTADSLHIGHYIPIMAMAHMQRAGHKPISLVGGGTGFVGDPSGRTDMRNMMNEDTINSNVNVFKQQLKRFISYEGENAAIMVDNASWLKNLNYIDFLRDIGVYFSVNKMLAADCFKTRMEKGLSFFEFNYMLMQSYDFLMLHQKYGCILQVGGNDQWSNMLFGADLIRRKERKNAYALTLTLLENSEGKKMGKTQKGALWLSKEKTTPYEFYQYFRNVEDQKVEECFKLLTFLPLSEIAELTKFKDERINEAKKRLAFEVTKVIHGEQEAKKAEMEALGAFGNGDTMPQKEVAASKNTLIIDLLILCGLCSSKSEARKLIEGGGVKIDDIKVDNISSCIGDFTCSEEFVLHKGKKIHIKIILKP